MAELRLIFAKAPTVVVTGPPYDGERSDINAAALALLASDYRVATQLPLGSKRVAIYRRRVPVVATGEHIRFN